MDVYFYACNVLSVVVFDSLRYRIGYFRIAVIVVTSFDLPLLSLATYLQPVQQSRRQH